jgi:HAD superfamily hydrolase (TIGR01549 family)
VRVTGKNTAVLVVRAVTVDLDDTLYPQAAYLAGAWSAVADAGAARGLDRGSLSEALVEICAEGSDRGRIIDRALARIGAPEDHIESLVDAFRSFTPDHLECHPGAVEALAALRAIVPVALVSDGDPPVQRAKLRALGLLDAFDAVVISDEMGRAFRKPHSAPFLRALSLLSVPARDAVHVGDRPDKDVAGPHRAGMSAVRVRQGEYAGIDDTPGDEPLATVSDVPAAFALVAELARHGLPGAASA